MTYITKRTGVRIDRLTSGPRMALGLSVLALPLILSAAHFA